MDFRGRLDEALDDSSRYCYPGTDVLKNNLGITNQEELTIAERRITTAELAALQLKPVPRPNKLFTPEYYFSLHKTIFGKIYPFAGQTRNENIMKGNTPFCRPEFIYGCLTDNMKTFSKRMVDLETRDDITTWLADFYGELNIIHPFREGNGRVAREYLRECVECLDRYLGFNYELDFSNVSEETSKSFMRASIISATTANNEPLKDFFDSRLIEKQVKQEKGKINKK